MTPQTALPLPPEAPSFRLRPHTLRLPQETPQEGHLCGLQAPQPPFQTRSQRAGNPTPSDKLSCLLQTQCCSFAFTLNPHNPLLAPQPSFVDCFSGVYSGASGLLTRPPGGEIAVQEALLLQPQQLRFNARESRLLGAGRCQCVGEGGEEGGGERCQALGTTRG